MHKSREHSVDDTFARELAAEQRLADGERIGDFELRQELGQLNAPPLPTALRARVLAHAAPRPAPVQWLAMAAAIVLSVVAILALQQPAGPTAGVEPTARDWADLAIAVRTLEASGQHVVRVTERELAQISPPTVELNKLPYADSARRWITPASHQPQRGNAP